MKRIASYFIAGFIGLSFCGCDNLLNLESETKVTNNYLYDSKEGLQRAIAGLYIYERNNIVDD